VQQKSGTLRISVALLDADRKARPVAGHVLRLETVPPGGTPQRIVIDADGRAEITIAAGSYVLQSERPVELQGRTYRWTQPVELKAGATETLNLSGENAITGTPPKEIGPDPMLAEWDGSYNGFSATLSLDRLEGPAYRGTLYIVTKKGAASTEINVELRLRGADVAIQEVGAVRLSGIRFWYLGSGTGKLSANGREMSGIGKDAAGNKYKWSFERK
jgi:hypothetical protein